MAKETTHRTRRLAPMPSEAERFAALRREAPVFLNASDDDIRAALARWFEAFFADLDALIAADNPRNLDQEDSQRPNT